MAVEGVHTLLNQSHLATIDYLIIVFYFVSVLAVGIWVSKKFLNSDKTIRHRHSFKFLFSHPGKGDKR